MLPVFIWACQSQDIAEDSRVVRLPFYEEATFSPVWLAPGEQPPADFHRIPAFELTNQEGQTVNQATFAGKIYVTDFFFTICPGICPKMTTNMALLQKAFYEDEDVLLLSHSVTPRQDSVPVLKAYAEAKGIDSEKWHLVTGEQQEIYRLGRKAYFVEEDLGLQKLDEEFLHTENFVLVDQNRYIRGIYNGLNRTSIEQLIVDIRTLQEEGAPLL
ncbi:MAG: SCO family protein [Bacteroidota bacterium]